MLTGVGGLGEHGEITGPTVRRYEYTGGVENYQFQDIPSTWVGCWESLPRKSYQSL